MMSRSRCEGGRKLRPGSRVCPIAFDVRVDGLVGLLICPLLGGGGTPAPLP
jgi:hypothetical protein